MTGQIFLIDSEDTLIAMEDTAYNSEDRLQQLLANYPDLLAGDQIDRDSPRRWVLVDREVAVPDHEDGAGRWSLDHLFLDQDGIPTIVEVKRASDSRTRREVVGQMLDYAANGVVYWPIQSLQDLFAKNCAARGLEPEQALIMAFGDDLDEASFWETVATNLRLGRVRLVFVVDRIPTELQRIVEFLNEQMSPAEVLAVEIKQYVGRDLRALVPRVIGMTAEADRRHQAHTGRGKWNAPRFLEELRRINKHHEAKLTEAILLWAEQQHIRLHWGTGKYTGTVMPRLRQGDAYSGPGVFTTEGVFWLDFWRMRDEPFSSAQYRQAFVDRLNALPGIEVPPDAIHRDSFTVDLQSITTDQYISNFIASLEWYFAELKQHGE